MFRRVISLALAVFLAVNLYGCIALVAGAAAGGAGTAVWLSRKMTQEVNASFEDSLAASKAALKSMGFKVNKETVTKKVAQIKSEYSDGRVIWIDIRRLTQLSSRIEVRVGAKGDKEAALEVLNEIVANLGSGRK